MKSSYIAIVAVLLAGAFYGGRYSKDTKAYDVWQPGVNFGDPLPNREDANRVKWQLAKFFTDVLHDPLYSHVKQACFWFAEDYEKWVKEAGLEMPQDYAPVMCVEGFTGGELPLRL